MARAPQYFCLAGQYADPLIFIVNVPKWTLSVIWQLPVIFIVSTPQKIGTIKKLNRQIGPRSLALRTIWNWASINSREIHQFFIRYFQLSPTYRMFQEFLAKNLRIKLFSGETFIKFRKLTDPVFSLDRFLTELFWQFFIESFCR